MAMFISFKFKKKESKHQAKCIQILKSQRKSPAAIATGDPDKTRLSTIYIYTTF